MESQHLGAQLGGQLLRHEAEERVAAHARRVLGGHLACMLCFCTRGDDFDESGRLPVAIAAIPASAADAGAAAGSAATAVPHAAKLKEEMVDDPAAAGAEALDVVSVHGAARPEEKVGARAHPHVEDCRGDAILPLDEPRMVYPTGQGTQDLQLGRLLAVGREKPRADRAASHLLPDLRGKVVYARPEPLVAHELG